MYDVRSSSRVPRLSEITMVLMIVAVTLLNGSAFLLKRTGVIENVAYERYLSAHIEGGPYARGLLPVDRYVKEQPFRTHLFRLEGWELLLKVLKDATVVALLVLSTVCVARSGCLPRLMDAWPGYLLTGVVGVAFLRTALEHGPLFPLTGARSFTFVLLAVLLAGCTSLRDTLARSLATVAGVLLVVESVAVCLEAVRGMPIYGYLTLRPAIPMRLTGTFDLPNTLGVFAVLAFAFRLSFVPNDRWTRLLLVLVIGLVILSSSGTGFVVLVAVGIGAMLHRLGRRALLPVAIAILGSISLLPAVTGRPDLFDSPLGRLTEWRHTWGQMTGSEIVGGRAFGAGTNTAFQLFREGGRWAIANPDGAFIHSADSLPAMLVLSTGLSGLLAFYLLLLWAAVRTPEFWPFWTAIGLTSLVVKVVELFPLSLFLASALSVAFATRARVERPG